MEMLHAQPRFGTAGKASWLQHESGERFLSPHTSRLQKLQQMEEDGRQQPGTEPKKKKERKKKSSLVINPKPLG